MYKIKYGRFKTLCLLFSVLGILPAVAIPSFDGDKPVRKLSYSYIQDFSTFNSSDLFGQWNQIDGGATSKFTSADAVNGYLQFLWSTKRILSSKIIYSTPYSFSSKIGYGSTSNRGGLVVRYPATLGSFEPAQEPSDPVSRFNGAGIAFYPSEDGTAMNIKFSGTIPAKTTPATPTPNTIVSLPIPAGKPNMKTGTPTINIEDYGTTIYVYYDSAPIARIELGSVVGLNYTSGTVYNASLNVAGTFTDKIVPLTGYICIAQRDAALRLFNVAIKTVRTFDENKPVTTYTSTYNQAFSTWDGDALFNQWNQFLPEDTNKFTAADVVNGYLQFAGSTKSILYSKMSFSYHYTFSAKIGYGSASNNGGLVVRLSDLIKPDEAKNSSAVGSGFNRAGIAFYPSTDGTSMNIKFSDTITIPVTKSTVISVPIPAGKPNMLTGTPTIKIEDFGNLIFVYYDTAPIARIELGGAVGKSYTSGVVFDASFNLAGTFSQRNVPFNGRVCISQGDASLRLFSVSIAKKELPKVYVTQIWDDAILNDLRLMDIIRKYKAKATFAVDAGNLTGERQPNTWVVSGVTYGKVSIDDIKKIYSEFEVACHGLSHKALTSLTGSALTYDIAESKRLLELWLNRPVKGFVYPGCPYDAVSKNAVKNAGFTWARTCERTPDFCSNTDPFVFRTTVAFNSSDFWKEFARIKATGGVFTFWGHAFFTTEAQWADIEAKIAQLSQDPAVVWMNTSDIFDQFQGNCQSSTIKIGNGNGLKRSLWKANPTGEVWFNDSICSSIEPQINESWGDFSPGCSISNDFWNARYTGEIESLYSENYTFYLTAKNLGKVWINNQLVIDGWGLNSDATLTGTIALTAGKKVPIKVDFAHKTGNAFLKLEWESASQRKEVVPQSQLYYSVPTSIQTLGMKQVAIFPNPAKNQIHIESNQAGVDNIRINDLQGRIVYCSNEQFMGAKTIDLSLAKGVYFVKLTGSTPFKTQKLIIE
jgi:peptidoglycan/xylan/chitin deacetylase (PgdA/CDA1 family)